MYEQIKEEGDYYEPGESYAEHSYRRDARGRYSRDGESNRRSAYGRGSYESGDSYAGESGRRRSYADGKEEVRQIMQEAMDAAQEPQMREKIRQCMEQLER